MSCIQLTESIVANNIPFRLENDPIVEALFEIRFQANVSQVSTLLPGLMYSSIAQDFEAPERLWAFEFPHGVIATQPSLQYQPTFRIKSKSYVILLGDSSLIISCMRPYEGWISFKALILKLLQALENTNLISAVERFSVKYINVFLEPSLEKQFKLLNLKTQMGDYDLTKHQTVMQTEIVEDETNNLIEIRSNVMIKNPDGKDEVGILVSVDVICNETADFWTNAEKNVDRIHSKEQQLFYGLLTKEAINSCKPIWK